MAHEAFNARGALPQQRIQADDAFEAYRELLLLQMDKPHLAQNEYFQALRDASFARHLLTMEALR